MDTVVRGAAVYLFLLIIFRLTGNRSLEKLNTFDLVLLLIVGESCQQALLGDDFSLTNGFVVILTLVVMDLAFSLWKEYSPATERELEGEPLIVVKHGKPDLKLMAKALIDPEDVLAAARQSQGLERMEQIKWAVLERNGSISIVPKEEAR